MNKRGEDVHGMLDLDLEARGGSDYDHTLDDIYIQT